MRRSCSIPFKRAGDLRLPCRLLHNGLPVPITGWQVDCWLRSKDGKLVQRLAFELVDPEAGRYMLTAPRTLTALWPVGELEGDIRYLDATGLVMHTATFVVDVLATITTPTP